MTEEERKKIDPAYCAKGLRQIMNRVGGTLTQYEFACLCGAISLLLDESMDKWLFMEGETK